MRRPRTANVTLTLVWQEHLAALEHGLNQARQHRQREANGQAATLSQLADHISTVQHALAELEAVLSTATHTQA